jgi:CRP-like cAMP-binding protein
MGEKSRKQLDPFIGTLERSGLTQGMTSEEIAELARIPQEKHFLKGAVILHEDSKSRDMYLIHEGRVSIQVSLPGGGAQEEVMYSMRDGQLFGELSLVDGAPRSASVRAEENVTVYQFDYEKTIALLDANPRIGYRLMRNLAGIISNRVRSTNMLWRNTLIW